VAWIFLAGGNILHALRIIKTTTKEAEVHANENEHETTTKNKSPLSPHRDQTTDHRRRSV
jgi:hypothetical protein